MPCQLGYTIFCVLFLGSLGFVISLIVLAPFYFSSNWSEKCTIERVIMIGFPCVGAVLGLIISPRNIDQGSSRRPESDQRSERQQRSSRVSESAQKRKTPQLRNQPTRAVMKRPLPGTIPYHLLPTLLWRLIRIMVVLPHVIPPIEFGLQDLEAQVMATSQSISDISDLNISRPAAVAPTAQNSSSWTTYLSSNSESTTILPPYAVLDPENPTLPTPSYSRYCRLSNSRYDIVSNSRNARSSRPTQELGPFCRLCQTWHSQATYVNNSD